MSKVKQHLDLFSGIGGFALAAKWVGYQTVGFCEIDNFCQKVLTKNFPGIPIYRDINELHYPGKIDLLTGGFPCQPFSQAGNKRGKNDTRYLWPEFKRIIHESHPNWIIIENVPGLVSMELDNIIFDLETEGYTPQSYIIPACATLAPHRRDRLWIIAYCNSLRSNEWICDRETGYLQKNENRNMAKIQQEWSQLIPDTWTTLTARDWILYNAEFSRRDDGLPSRLDKDRIKSLGNAIVPQVIYPIMRYIYEQG